MHRSREGPAPLSIGGRFKGFGPEVERAAGKADVRQDKALMQLKTAWGRFEVSKASYWNASAFEKDIVTASHYHAALSLVRGSNHSPEDIGRFALAIAEFQDEEMFSLKSGLMLSALIGSGDGRDHVVNTRHLSIIGHLGYRNTKEIVIQGDGGYCLGDRMGGGKMTVEGNVDIEAGHAMRGGVILIRGDAGYGLGDKMEGGEIHIEGDFESLGRVRGGRIFHRGIPIAGASE